MIQIIFKTGLGIAGLAIYLAVAFTHLREATEAVAKPTLKVFPGETIHIKTKVSAYASLN